MSKEAIEKLHQGIDVLADKIGDGTLIIERDTGKDYAIISVSYLNALVGKAYAYDDLTADPEEKEAEERAIREKFPDCF